MNDELTGKVFDIQGFTVNDGPGIRTEIFLKGCPLKCLWCHSPESQSPHMQVAWFEIRCIGLGVCGKCLEACPGGAITEGKTIVSKVDQSEIQVIDINRELCDNCGKCAVVCPANALAVCGTDMTVEQVLNRINKDRLYYRRSGGGVTLSGGEPMMQYEFSTAVFKQCKDQGINTALDTTGFARWDHYRAILEYTDLVLFDIKHMDSNRSLEITGRPNDLILENARKMAAAGISLQIRIPIVPGYNDSQENLQAIGRFCSGLGDAVTLVQLLPYHRLGLVKYERLQKKYQLEDIIPPPAETMEAHKSLIESYGLKVQIH
ncbi:MAG: glycyl-radical enzyme activating protein [Dehalococcoidales bacterium]|nr:glycyl-radical enzyme activating protein [Dehalococcoidales bacterium]